MFGIDLGSFIVIMVVAIIFLGPDKLPDMIIQIVKFFRSFKNTIQEAKDTIQKEIDIHDLKNTAVEYKEKIEKLTDNINNPASMYNNKEVSDMFGDITKDFKEIEEGLKKEIEAPIESAPKAVTEEVKTHA
jgi:sec-independent protein translocase protein TatB